MSISEQVKELRVYANSSLYTRESKARELLSQAADTIESLFTKLQVANEELESANMERVANFDGDWIPCSKKLPEQDGEYLCTQEVHSLSSGKKICTSTKLVEFYKKEWKRAQHLKVVAWQPLPEPYQSKE